MKLRLFLSFVIVAFSVPFITYDTGIRCITAPCEGATKTGGLIEFFTKSYNFNAYIIHYYLFFGAWLAIFLIMKFIDKIEK
jgi:hypothetical protein